jgi:hypothetical protein
LNFTKRFDMDLRGEDNDVSGVGFGVRWLEHRIGFSD